MGEHDKDQERVNQSVNWSVERRRKKGVGANDSNDEIFN